MEIAAGLSFCCSAAVAADSAEMKAVVADAAEATTAAANHNPRT